MNNLKFYAKRVTMPNGTPSGDPRVWPPGDLCTLASDFDALAAENERLRAQIAERDASIEEWSGTAVQNGMECDRLTARVAELERDAARYGWIDRQKDAWAVLGEAYGLASEHDGAGSLSGAIDAALAQLAKDSE